MPVHVGQAALDAVVVEGQPLVVDAEQVQRGGVQVVAVAWGVRRLEAEVVARAVGDAALECRRRPSRR